ncbi:DUF1489 domain-containing protein [Meridianimarinicoccus roseus]|jgi:hypothetical protein|uniref:DUF1489 domain-containing protein n=1 Tax=Meridianimarinicoccus roseus TaxID=2072018 RepID=A0A2V2L7X8_9RHOB|nr:DUF1489 domain-containing protein [Meridianimarinicoccus roseus]PWR01480.1 DUF1489 domain-containing protein [Meridianimarinicoccus roseus]
MADHINLVKLCVGAEKLEDLLAWQAQRVAQNGQGAPRHVTRMWPKRAAELLAGGSLYWVFKGVILARQRIVRLDEVTGEDGIARCGIVLDPVAVRTAPSPRKPFQGWRYLRPEDAPPDLRAGRAADDALPPSLDAALAEIGVL